MHDIRRYLDIIRAGLAPARLAERFAGLTSHYGLAASRKALADHGWAETSVADTYANADAPAYSIDLDINHPDGDGPFSLYKGGRWVAQLAVPPYASHVNLGTFDHRRHPA